MTRVLHYIGPVALFILLCFSLITDQDQSLVLPVNIVILFMLLNNLGKSIALREIIALFMAVTCLLMPYLGYGLYGRSDHLASLWLRFMHIDADRYFSFSIPAVVGYSFTLCFPYGAKVPDKGQSLMTVFRMARRQLDGNYQVGVVLLLIGVITSPFVSFLPVSMQFFFNLFYFSSFAGLLYLMNARPFPYRIILIVGFLAFIFANALQQGMFTVVVYMGMTALPVVMIGVKAPLWRKTLFFLLGVFLIAVLQSIKPGYRKAVWDKNFQGSNIEVFQDLVVDKISDPTSIFTKEQFFFIYYRMNQGFNQALVMKHIPAKRDFDEGENLFVSIASSVIPRFLWPDKPEAGGKANMKYYTGYTITTWATNVGPMGEAYGSFGTTGGIIYMMLLGLFVRFYFGKVLKLSKRFPLLIFWMPVLFYQVSYSAENDTLQILNSLFKTSLFIFLLYKMFPRMLEPGRPAGNGSAYLASNQESR